MTLFLETCMIIALGVGIIYIWDNKQVIIDFFDNDDDNDKFIGT